MTAAHVEKSLLRCSFASNATAQQPTPKRATADATSTQQAPAKPASLLDIARNKLRNKHATTSENGTQQAQFSSVQPGSLLHSQFASNCNKQQPHLTTSWGWLLHYRDHEPVEVYTSPESTHSEVLRDFPGAIAAEPIAEIPE